MMTEMVPIQEVNRYIQVRGCMVCPCIIKQNMRDFERSCSRYKENGASERQGTGLTRYNVNMDIHIPFGQSWALPLTSSLSLRRLASWAQALNHYFLTLTMRMSLTSLKNPRLNISSQHLRARPNFNQRIPSVLALLFLTLLGLLAFDCLFIAGILLFCDCQVRTVEQEKW
jgi:hypothetical protein